jgi:hypothetical protein
MNEQKDKYSFVYTMILVVVLLAIVFTCGLLFRSPIADPVIIQMNYTNTSYVDRIIEINHTQTIDKIQYVDRPVERIVTVDNMRIVSVCNESTNFSQLIPTEWKKACIQDVISVGDTTFVVIGYNKKEDQLFVSTYDAIYKMSINETVRIKEKRVVLREMLISDITKQVCGWFEIK